MYSERHYRARSNVALEMSGKFENARYRQAYLELSEYWGHLADKAKMAATSTASSFPERPTHAALNWLNTLRRLTS